MRQTPARHEPYAGVWTTKITDAAIFPSVLRIGGIFSQEHTCIAMVAKCANRQPFPAYQAIDKCGRCNIDQFEKGCFGAHKHQINNMIDDAHIPLMLAPFVEFCYTLL